jgi:hypothetical protein
VFKIKTANKSVPKVIFEGKKIPLDCFRYLFDFTQLVALPLPAPLIAM